MSEDKNDRKQNPVINIAKLIFCLGVMLNHTNKLRLLETEAIVMAYGYLGVEFFFVVSGYLMAKKAMADNEGSLADSTLKFIFRKISIFYPYFLIVTIIAFVVVHFKNVGLDLIIHNLILSVPYLMLLQMSGIPCFTPNDSTWYLSAMILCMIVLYPMAKKYKKNFICIIAPIVATIAYSYFGFRLGHLASVVPIEDDLICSGIFRALGGLCLGCFAYAAADYLKSLKFNKLGKILLTVLELALYILAWLSMQTQWIIRLDFLFVILIFAAVSISFSEQSYSCKPFKNDCALLNKISTILYLVDIPAVTLVAVMYPTYSRMRGIFPMSAFIIAFAALTWILGEVVKLGFNSFKEKIIIR